MPFTPEDQAELDALDQELESYDYYSVMNSDVEEETVEENNGFFSNIARGMGERATDLGAGLAGAAEDAREGLTDVLGGDLRVGYNLRNEDSGFDIGFFTPEEIDKQETPFNRIDEALSDVDLGYEQQYTLSKMKEDPTITNVVGFGLDTLGRSMVDMAGMYASLPLYFTARENELAEERATNDGREEPTFGDYAKVAPGNAVATLMDKWSFGKLIDVKAGKEIVEQAGKGALTKEIGKRILKESATEGLVQEPAEYLTTHVGTEKGVDVGELGDVALGGAIGGAFGGGLIGGPAAAIQQKANNERLAAERSAELAANNAELDTILQNDIAVDVFQEFTQVDQDTAPARAADQEILATMGETTAAPRSGVVTNEAEPLTVNMPADVTPTLKPSAEEVVEVEAPVTTNDIVTQAETEAVNLITKVNDNKTARKLRQAVVKQEKATKVAQNRPTPKNIEAAQIAAEQVEIIKEDAQVREAKVKLKEVKKAAKVKAETVKELEATRLEDAAFVTVREGKRSTEAIVESFNPETNEYTVQKLDKKGNNKGNPVVMPAKQVKRMKDRVTAKEVEQNEAEAAAQKQEEDVVNTAFSKVQDKGVVGTPVEIKQESNTASSTTKPNVDITPREKFLTEREDWNYLGEGQFEDDMGDIHSPVEANLNRLLASRGIDVEGNPVVGQRDGKVVKQKLSKADKKLADVVAKQETAVKKIEDVATKAKAVQENEVEVNAEIGKEVAVQTTIETEGEVAPVATETEVDTKDKVEVKAQETTPKATKKSAKGKKGTYTYNVDTLDDAIFDGRLSEPSVRKLAEISITEDTGMVSKEDAKAWLDANKEADAETNTRQDEQRNGWINAGIDQNAITYAEKNPEVYQQAENIKASEDVSFVEAAKNAIEQHMADGLTREAINLNYKIDNPSSVKLMKEAFIKAFGTDFTQGTGNVRIVNTAADLKDFEIDNRSADVTAFIDGQNKITIIADRVTKGEEVSLLMHEKGVHELMSKSPAWKRVLGDIERILKDDKDPDHWLVFMARRRAKQAKAKSSQPQFFNLEEETVAYLIQSEAVNVPFYKRMIERIKQAFRQAMGDPKADLRVSHMVMMADALIQRQAGSNIKEYARIKAEGIIQAEEAADIEAQLISDFEEGGMDVSVAEAVAADVIGTEETEFVSQVAKAPQNIHATAWDNAKHFAGKVGDKFLGFIPQSDLILKAVGQGITSLGALENITNVTRAEAHANIDKANKEVLAPLSVLQKTDQKSYNELQELMVKATTTETSQEGTRRFNKMSPLAQSLYRKIEAYYKDQANKYIVALETQVADLGMSAERSSELRTMIGTFKKSVSKGNYFPMQRFGKYRLDATDTQGRQYVSFSDRIVDLNNEADQLRKEGYTINDVGTLAKFSHDAKSTMDPELYKKAERIVSEMGGSEVAQEALWKTFMQMAPSAALKDRMRTRRFVHGASTDVVRGIASTINFYQDISRRMYSSKRANVLEAAKIEVSKLPKGNKKEIEAKFQAEATLSEVITREDLAGKVRANWSSAASKWNFVLNLGFNVSSAMINLTQNAIVGVPILGSQFGAIKSSMAMTKALSDTVIGLNQGEKFLKGNEKKAFQEWQKQGTLDMTQANLHTQLAEGPVTGMNSKMDTAVEYSAFMFHHAEIANRVSAGLAAYRLYVDNAKNVALESGQSYDEAAVHEEAVLFSGKSINDIHFDYSEEGKSRLQRTDLGAVALAFKSYPIKMAFYMLNNVKRAINKESSPENKKEARKQIAGTMIMTAMFGGSMALPLNSVLMLLMDTLYFDDDEDAHEEFREWTVDNFGEDGSEIVMNGLVSYMTGTNLSGRVSLDKMFFRIPDGGGTPKQWADEVLASIIGPVGSRIGSVPDGIQLMSEGKFHQGMEKFMPSIYASTSKAVRWGTEGTAHNAYDTLMEKDFDSKDAVARMMGFTSLEYSRHSSKYWMEKRIERTTGDKKKKLMRGIAMALISGDKEDRREARLAIREFNRQVAISERISQSAISRRVRDLRKKLDGRD